MRFYTKQESDEWISGRGLVKPDLIPELSVERIKYPPDAHRFFYIAHWIATSLIQRKPTMLLTTEWAIWGSSENWHLYYKLRQSYGDQRLLHEAPGHLFLEHEAEDLASFLQVSMLNGWGGYVLAAENDVSAFFSHDEFIDFFAASSGSLEDVRKELGSKQTGTGDRR